MTVPKNQVYVSGMPTRDVDEPTLIARLASLCGEQILESTIYRDVDGQTYGYGWVTFEGTRNRTFIDCCYLIGTNTNAQIIRRRCER